jgi:hypothetical protein
VEEGEFAVAVTDLPDTLQVPQVLSLGLVFFHHYYIF